MRTDLDHLFNEPSEAIEDNDSLPDLSHQSKVAVQISEYLKKEFVFDDIIGCWYQYKTNKWERIRTITLKKWLIEFINNKSDDNYTLATINSTIRFLEILNHVDGWEKSKTIIPFLNGLHDFGKNESLGHDSKHLINWQLPYNYDKNAECPKFEKWIKEASGDDDDVIKTLRSFLKLVLFGNTDYQKFIELIGDGGTGKSTFLNISSLLIGEENVAITSLSQLEGNRFETAGIYGKKLIQITDSGLYTGNIDTLKAIVGQDTIRFEEKYKQHGTFKPDCLVMIAGNIPLKSSDLTSALQRRRIPIKFNHKPENVNRNLLNELKQELPGILNWVLKSEDEDTVKYVGELQGSVKETLIEVSIENDPLMNWIKDNLEVSDENKIELKAKDYKKQNKREDYDYKSIESDSDKGLYPNYLQYAIENNIEKSEIFTSKTFSNQFLISCKKLEMNKVKRDTTRSASGAKIIGVKIKQESAE